ncbi:MAG: IS1595 family transposase [Verrucomicrobiota bacterium]
MAGDLPFPTSLPDFQRLFPDERACVDYMVRVRWPAGFVCSICGMKETPLRISTRPRVLRCSTCHREASVTAGTVMHRSHSPLSVWFWAAYLVTSMTPGMSAVQFQRQLGLGRYETAFQILHKLRAAMVRPHRDRIGAPFPVEMDETWIGGPVRTERRSRCRTPGVRHKDHSWAGLAASVPALATRTLMPGSRESDGLMMTSSVSERPWTISTVVP